MTKKGSARLAVTVGILIILVQALLSVPARAQVPTTVSNNQALLKFPEWVAFSVDLKGESEITRVVLEYRVERLTCGNVIAKAFPKFTPAKEVKARWTWEMKQSGSEPPGAIVSWRWRVTNADGKELVTDWQQVRWRDDLHPWQSLIAGSTTLHWYNGDRAFGSALLSAASQTLDKWAQTAGLKPDAPINIYVYGSSQDMRDAIFYEPGWTGGRAYSSHSIIILGIAPSELAWGRRSITHELTHILFGRYSFGCMDDPPLWLREGLAMYSEGELGDSSSRLFKAAVASDRLASVRALASNFPESSEEASVSYSESYSLVNFLIGEYGQRKIMTLLDAVRGGVLIDDALRSTYGFDVDGLEDAWRAKIGAQPRRVKASTAATATPTIVPTYAPVAGLQIPTRTPTLVPATATFAATATSQPETTTPLPTVLPSPETVVAVPVASTSSVAIEPWLVGAFGVLGLAVVTFILVRRRNG